jgi:hypothetical protein
VESYFQTGREFFLVYKPMSHLKEIPYFVDPPPLSPSLIDEITYIHFGEPIPVEPCDIIFVFGGSHPGLWEKSAEAFFDNLGQDIIVTGGTRLVHYNICLGMIGINRSPKLYDIN